MLDVHPPHSAIHGIRDFLLHLFTITIGLLIALGLEGCVERAHHRELVHEAETSLRAEIQNNANALSVALNSLHKQQTDLDKDITVLRYIAKNHKRPADASMSIHYGIHTRDDVAWKTAQTTAAVSYMPYSRVQEYADIYSLQEQVNLAEEQAARDAIISIAPFINATKDSPDPSPAQAEDIIGKIGILQGQLSLVDAAMKTLDSQYKKFLSEHPAGAS